MVTIALPDGLTKRLQVEADNRQLSLDELAIDVLANALDIKQEIYPSVEQVIAEIKAMEPNLTGFHPATQSLADLLSHAPDDPNFDLEEWNREWKIAEAEIKAMTRANALAEGHG